MQENEDVLSALKKHHSKDIAEAMSADHAPAPEQLERLSRKDDYNLSRHFKRIKIIFLYLVFFLVAALLVCIGGLSVWVLWHHIADVAADVKKSHAYINDLFIFFSTISITLFIEHIIIKKWN